MTDFDRPVHDPTTDTETTAIPVPTEPVGATPANEAGTFEAPAAVIPADTGTEASSIGSAGRVDEASTIDEVSPTTAASAATVPVSAATTAGPRRSRTRWLAAGAIVALIVGVTAIGTLMLTGAAPTSTVAGYVSADSLMYGELRLDLPGDQRQKIGQFLAKFPGFADQAALDRKLDEVLDRLTSEGTNGDQTYTRDIKPWFDGELGFSIGAIPTSDDPAKAADTRVALLLSVKDEALARSWFTKVLADTGITGTTQDHQGIQLTVFDDPAMVGAVPAAFALVGGKVAIVGDVASVKAAIDTKGAGGLAKAEGYTAAKAALDGDSIGFFFFDMRRLIDASLKMTQSLASAPPISDELLKIVPDWAAYRLRVDGDALLMDAVAPHVDAAPGPDENRATKIADYAPPSTIMLGAGNDAGKTMLDTIALYRLEPSLAEAFTGIDQAVGIIGGLEAALGWMGDTGVVVAAAGDSVEGGIVSVPADAAGASRLMTTLRSFVQLGGSQAGITIRDEDHNGTPITIIDLGTASDLAGLAGALGGMPLPTDPGSLPDGHIEISYAATDQVVIIGSSPDFVRHSLDAAAGASLADDTRYQALIGRVGASNTGVSFIDIAAVRGLVEGLLSQASPAERAEYEESVKPFLLPFDALVGASVRDGAVDQMHVLMTVK